MAVFDPTPPSFSIQAQVPTRDIGAGYAAGITQAGQSIAGALSSKPESGGVFDIMNRNRTADDTLAAMQQNKILTPDQYNSVANKGLGAKEQMLGMYAGQWIAQQAANRELQKAGYQGNVEVDVAHQKLLDQISAVKSGYGAAAGVDQKKLLANPNANAGTTQPVAPVAPLVGPSGPLPAPQGVTPQIQARAAQLAGTASAPTPLGSGDIYNPGPKLGSPVQRKGTVIPPGATIVSGKGPKGEQAQFLKYPDGTLSPIQ
jgi:hypothetical protein